MEYIYKLTHNEDLVDESSLFDISDDEIITEKFSDTIKKMADSIDTLIKKIVENFNRLMEKNKLDKQLKELKKVPKDAKVKSNVDLKEAAKTYNELMDQYQKTVNNPTEVQIKKLVETTEKAKKKRKKIILGSAVAVSVSAVVGYLYLLKNKNNYKNYKLLEKNRSFIQSLRRSHNSIEFGTKRGSEAIKEINDFNDKLREDSKTLMKKDTYHRVYSLNDGTINNILSGQEDRDNFSKRYKKWNDEYELLTTSKNALQESEFYRLTLYKDLNKSVKSVLNNIKGTFKYGIKNITSKNPKVTDDMVKTSDENIKKITKKLTDEYKIGRDKADKMIDQTNKLTDHILNNREEYIKNHGRVGVPWERFDGPSIINMYK